MRGRFGKQRGAALIIVLLLAATLSLIVLTLIAAMSLSIRRTAGTALRGELLWRAVSVETIAAEAISTALRQADLAGQPLTLNHSLFSQQFEIPFDGGGGAVIFADATRCFNINSLSPPSQADASAASADERSDEAREFISIVTALGLGEGDASDLASVITDWVDRDDIQEIGGAEDGFYSALPTPFRTGDGPVASVSELRAMRGMDPALYAEISPFLCAAPNRNGMVININMLRPDQGVLLTGLTEGALSPDDAGDLIAQRPPGGWTSVDQFLALPAFEEGAIDQDRLRPRLDVTSQYIEAQAGATINEIDMNVRLMFAVGAASHQVGVIGRQLGSGA